MRIVRTVADVRAAVRDARSQGASVGLVPTMGALHDGHLSLIRRARDENGLVVVSLSAAGFAVLGRAGDGGLNHTLLDRDYGSGWLGASIVVVLAFAAGAITAQWGRARRRRADGVDPGGR